MVRVIQLRPEAFWFEPLTVERSEPVDNALWISKMEEFPD